MMTVPLATTTVSLSGPDAVHGIIPSPLVKYERGPDSDVSTGGVLPEYQVCVEKDSLQLRESGNKDSNLMERGDLVLLIEWLNEMGCELKADLRTDAPLGGWIWARHTSRREPRRNTKLLGES